MKEKISYEELETLVHLYQDGSSDASERLIHLYEGYFKKFLHIFTSHRFNIDDKTQRGFVRTFIRDENVRRSRMVSKPTPYQRKVFYLTAMNIQTGLRHLEEGDLLNEMALILLTMADAHNGKAPFSVYVARYFPLKLHSVIRELLLDPADDIEIPFDEDMPETACYDTYSLDEFDVPYYHIAQLTPTDYDENWINGYTAEGMFAYLTVYERRMLKWYYEWKTLDADQLPEDIYEERKTRLRKNETEIADLLGCSRKTINIKRNDIKRELAKLSTNLHLISE